MRQAADVVEANTGTSPPATSSTATTTGSWSSYALTAGESSTITLPPPPAGVVNEPISWPQLLGSWADLAVTFLLAALPGIVTYLSGVGALTPRVIVSLGLSAIVAGLLAVQHATGSAPLMLRLRAMGQIEK
jgi:hypothetical protein